MRPLIMLILVLSLLGCAGRLPASGVTVPASPADAARTGADALAEGRHGQAKAAFQSLLRARPDDPEAALGLAEAQLGLGEVAEARTLFVRAAQAEGSARTMALQGLGLADLRLGDSAGAEAALAAAVAQDPSAWRAWNGLAHLHDAAGRWAEADEAYARALAHSSEPELVHNNWGMSLLARGDHAAAAGRFEDALRARPGFATADTNLRIALAMGGQSDHVLSTTPDPDLPEVLNNLGYIAMVQGDLQRAEAYFHQALEASPRFYGRAFENLQRLAAMRPTAARG